MPWERSEFDVGVLFRAREKLVKLLPVRAEVEGLESEVALHRTQQGTHTLTGPRYLVVVVARQHDVAVHEAVEQPRHVEQRRSEAHRRVARHIRGPRVREDALQQRVSARAQNRGEDAHARCRRNRSAA